MNHVALSHPARSLIAVVALCSLVFSLVVNALDGKHELKPTHSSSWSTVRIQLDESITYKEFGEILGNYAKEGYIGVLVNGDTSIMFPHGLGCGWPKERPPIQEPFTLTPGNVDEEMPALLAWIDKLGILEVDISAHESVLVADLLPIFRVLNQNEIFFYLMIPEPSLEEQIAVFEHDSSPFPRQPSAQGLTLRSLIVQGELLPPPQLQPTAPEK